jgi:hypothetical protein
MTSAPEISPRLYRALGDAFGEMDPAALELVASSLREGALPWFLDELADAIRLGLLRPALWEKAGRSWRPTGLFRSPDEGKGR